MSNYNKTDYYRGSHRGNNQGSRRRNDYRQGGSGFNDYTQGGQPYWNSQARYNAGPKTKQANKSPHVEKDAAADLAGNHKEKELQALKESVKQAKLNKNKTIATPVSPVPVVQAQPEKATDVYRLLNSHLADAGEPQKRLKKSSEHCEWAEKPRDIAQETASSHHEEEGSLGKRSASDAGELKLYGRRKDVGHFLDSINLLEGMLAGLESAGLATPGQPVNEPESPHDKLQTLFTLVERVEQLRLA